jgi:hypothetical protein
MSDRTNAEPRDRVTLREGDKRPTAPLLAPLGSMPGGLEFPPRRYPPDPQHLDIPQTYDPRVSVQLERTARDIAAGMPGAAAREDAERATPENPRGSPPPAPREGVDVVTERETPVTFNQHFASYNAGETAAFTADEAARLADLGVTGDVAPPEGGAAPVNTVVPAVTQLADTLSCSTGTWDGAPTTYGYAWKLDGADVGTDSASHTVTAADAGKSATCIVTATNATGSTAAPASTGVVVTDPGGA